MGRSIVVQLQSKKPKAHLHSRKTGVGKTSFKNAIDAVDDIRDNRKKKGIPQDRRFQDSLTKQLHHAKNWFVGLRKEKEFVPKEGTNYSEEFCEVEGTIYRIDIEFHGFGKDHWEP